MPDESRRPERPRSLEANFGWSTPYSLGIEEEFQLVDAETLELVAGIEPVLEVFSGEALQRRVKPELLQSVVEASTRISVDVEEAVADLAELRGRLARAAADNGAADRVGGDASTLPLRPSDGDRPAAVHGSRREIRLADRPPDGVRPAHPRRRELGRQGDRVRQRPARLRSRAAGAVGKLAVLAGAPDRARLDPRARHAGPAADRPAPGLRLVRRVRAARRAGRRNRLLPRLHPSLVGHPAAPQVRDGRGADLRCPDADRERRRDRRPRPGAHREAGKRLRMRRDRRRRRRTSCSRRTGGGRPATAWLPA